MDLEHYRTSYGLHNSGIPGYIHWDYDSPDITLDGTFTPSELRQIADFMDANKAQ